MKTYKAKDSTGQVIINLSEVAAVVTQVIIDDSPTHPTTIILKGGKEVEGDLSVEALQTLEKVLEAAL